MHHLSKEKVINNLNSSIVYGLSSKIVSKRLEQVGLNKLSTIKPISPFIIFLKQLKSPLIIVLIIAAVISAIFKEFIDAGVIVITVLLNSFIGFFQEYKAEKTMESIKNMIVFECIVLRNGKKLKIRTENLVPGDIVFLEQGLNVPADCRILEANELMVNEAILTGESLPINKTNKILHINTALAERINMVYMGTAVVSGRATAIVTATGNDTELGGINNLIQKRGIKFPLQEKIEKMTIQITFVIIIACILMFFAGLMLNKNMLEMFLLSVSITVSSIPEGLAIGVTVILALSAKNILKNNALVRNLYSAQTLGSTTVICTDKTGTITEGKMFVDSLITFNQKIKISSKEKNYSRTFNKDINRLIFIGINCNNSSIDKNYNDEDGIDGILGMPTENAILYFAYKNNSLDVRTKFDEIPFNSDRKFMATLHECDNCNMLSIKGAPEKIFEKCDFILDNGGTKKINDKNLNQIVSTYNNLASSGLRIIACAYKDFDDEYKKIKHSDIKSGFVFVGFFAIKDPLRKDARSVINTCKKAGVKICMLTGDNKMIASSIGKEIGLLDKNFNVVDGTELDLMSDKELQKNIKKINIFARVTPNHKLRIVNALRNNGEVVAMTGDGVNDAPALKLSDVGVALGSGTDIAKEASDIVLMNDDLSNIVKSIEQGRIIFTNIRKLSFFLLSDCFAGVVLIAGTMFIGLPTPLTVSQILIANLIQDGLPAMFLANEKNGFDFLKSKPVAKNYGILNFELALLSGISSLVIGLSTLFSFAIASNMYDINKARTLAFCVFSFTSVFYIFSAKNLEKSFKLRSFIDNKLLTISVIFSLLLQLFIIYNPVMNYIFNTEPLMLTDLLYVLIVGVSVIIFIEIIKILFKLFRKNLD